MLRLRLLAGAWSPAAFFLALRVSKDHERWAIVLVGLGVVGVVTVALLLRARQSTNAQPFTLTNVDDESAQVATYLITFVFPFLFLDLGTWRDVVACVGFAALTAALVLTTDLVLVSPTLLLAGYHLYKVTSSSGFSGIMLAKKRPAVGQTVMAVRLPGDALKLTSIGQ